MDAQPTSPTPLVSKKPPVSLEEFKRLSAELQKAIVLLGELNNLKLEYPKIPNNKCCRYDEDRGVYIELDFTVGDLWDSQAVNQLESLRHSMRNLKDGIGGGLSIDYYLEPIRSKAGNLVSLFHWPNFADHNFGSRPRSWHELVLWCCESALNNASESINIIQPTDTDAYGPKIIDRVNGGVALWRTQLDAPRDWNRTLGKLLGEQAEIEEFLKEADEKEASRKLQRENIELKQKLLEKQSESDEPDSPAAAIREGLRGQLLKLFNFLQSKKNFVAFDTLRDERDLWRNGNPADRAITAALEKLQAKLNELAPGWCLTISEKDQRCKLEPPRPAQMAVRK